MERFGARCPGAIRCFLFREGVEFFRFRFALDIVLDWSYVFGRFGVHNFLVLYFESVSLKTKQI